MSSSLFLTRDWGRRRLGRRRHFRGRRYGPRAPRCGREDPPRAGRPDAAAVRGRHVDMVFCEGVLHHTPSTRAALESVTRLLRAGGEILFYVYVRKGPDPRVHGRLHARPTSAVDARGGLGSTPIAEAWARRSANCASRWTSRRTYHCSTFPPGRYDLQRLFYWHFASCSNDLHTLEEITHINFDWYHPRNAHRQTAEEVRAWCVDFRSTSSTSTSTRAASRFARSARPPPNMCGIAGILNRDGAPVAGDCYAG